MKPARALAAGLLVALSLPPWGWWPLAFVGIALFETSLGAERLARRTAFWHGWLFGLGWLAPGMAWMWYLSAPGYVVASALFAAFHGVAAIAAPTGRWRVIGRPAAHTLAEALRMCFPFGGVPLATLGIGQVAGPLADMARVGGVLLITWATFQIGFALAGPSPFVPARSGADRSLAAPHGVVALCAVAAILLLSLVAPSGTGTGTWITVSTVQGGGPQGTRAIDTPDQIVIDRALAATRTIPDDAGRTGEVDMVLWPENVIDVDGRPFAGSAAHALVAAEAARIGAPFSVGVTEDAGPRRFVNTQVIIDVDGNIVSRYDKVRRVPFGEYMPMRGLLDALGAPVDQVPNDAIAGVDPAVLTAPIAGVGDVDMSVVISWEVFFGGRVREGVHTGGTFVTNPTNGSSYTGTILQTQQVASSRLRAIETGRWVAQAAPTGFSAFVSPEGDVYDRTSVSEQAVITRDVELREGLTWYARLGDLPVVAAMVALLAVAWLGALGRLRKPGTASRPGAADEPGTEPAAELPTTVL